MSEKLTSGCISLKINILEKKILQSIWFLNYIFLPTVQFSQYINIFLVTFCIFFIATRLFKKKINNLAGILGRLSLLQLQQNWFHSCHILWRVLIGIFTTKIAQFCYTIPFSARSYIIDFGHKFFLIFTIGFLGFIQIVLITFVPEIGFFKKS